MTMVKIVWDVQRPLVLYFYADRRRRKIRIEDVALHFDFDLHLDLAATLTDSSGESVDCIELGKRGQDRCGVKLECPSASEVGNTMMGTAAIALVDENNNLYSSNQIPVLLTNGSRNPRQREASGD